MQLESVMLLVTMSIYLIEILGHNIIIICIYSFQRSRNCHIFHIFYIYCSSSVCGWNMELWKSVWPALNMS